MTTFDADLATIVEHGAPAFMLLSRPGSGRDLLEIFVGEPVIVCGISELPLPPADPSTNGHDLIAVVSYRQITERGLACVDDGEPLVAVDVRAQADIPIEEAIRRLPDEDVELDAGAFDVNDAEYQAITQRVIDTDIGRGAGSNFVIRRSFRATLRNPSRRIRLSVFRRLLLAERGAYWTFLVHWHGRTLIGSTPECQARSDGRTATMNPISGTYRYPDTGPSNRGLMRFLADRKETEELFMVVDEELKTMARVCDGGGRLRGPWLRPMSRLAHTEYLIEGPSRLDVRDVLRRTLPTPTVAGSPLATACRVIAEHERTGRGYYGGALALFGRRGGRHTLDSALLIRTADVDPTGRVEIGVGATLVRQSDPAAEAAETRAKAAALLLALGRRPDTAVREAMRPLPTSGRLRRALAARNHGLSGFWRGQEDAVAAPELADRRLLVIDAEDDFTAMLAQLAGALGLDVRVRRFDRIRAEEHDLVLVGPGPGDPRDRVDPRIARLHELTRDLLAAGTPFLAVCLGHQVLADELGLAIHRLAEPAQGVQRTVPLYGRPERVGFYNTFVATSGVDSMYCPVTGDRVRILRDPATDAVHALSKPRMRSVQFHVESVLTEHGPAILRHMLSEIVTETEKAKTATPSPAQSVPSSGGRWLPSGNSPGDGRRPPVGRKVVQLDHRGREQFELDVDATRFRDDSS